MPEFENTAAARKGTPGIKVVGDPDAWELLCKASCGRWSKSTKRMTVAGGWLYQVTTEHISPEGVVTACAEALTFVPDVVNYCSGQPGD